MGLSSEDIPTTEGPNASLPFGEATDFRRANREMQTAGTSPRNPFPSLPGTPQSQQPQPAAAPVGGLPPLPAGPVQAPPPSQRGAQGERLDPTNVFSQWDGDGLGAMQRLELWANHPSRPRVIGMLADRARSVGRQPHDPAAQ